MLIIMTKKRQESLGIFPLFYVLERDAMSISRGPAWTGIKINKDICPTDTS